MGITSEVPKAGAQIKQTIHLPSSDVPLEADLSISFVPAIVAYEATEDGGGTPTSRKRIQTAREECPKSQPGGQGRIRASTDECF